MSRSFGDLCACRAGVIQQPEIIDRKLTEHDKAIVLASDGVWEFLDNNTVMNILIPHLEAGTSDKGINDVVKQSVANWKNEDVVIDDITIVLAEINPKDENYALSANPSKRTLRIKSSYRSIPIFH